KAAVKAPENVKIRSGYSANAEIVLERADNVLAVPESAIEFSGDTTFVYVLTAAGEPQTFRRQQVEVGMSDGIKIAIKSGISENEQVRGLEINEE
ncbi:MAG: efflux transporter periplasmic adaptor subunit, partial [Bacteroidaceae bacterium]|nr:efflux transporter periplasmic adaptor subunit [Bacteroidaceae bacterium]